MTIFRRILLRTKNISDKICRDNRNTQFMFNFCFFLKSWRLWHNVEKYGRTKQATDDNILGFFALCMLDSYGYRHGLSICDTYRFSTIRMVTRTCPSVTLHEHWLSCCTTWYLHFRNKIQWFRSKIIVRYDDQPTRRNTTMVLFHHRSTDKSQGVPTSVGRTKLFVHWIPGRLPTLTIKDETYLFYIKTQSVPRCEHSPPQLYETNLLMSRRVKVHTEHLNAVWVPWRILWMLTLVYGKEPLGLKGWWSLVSALKTHRNSVKNTLLLEALGP
jgi:hypothetical protein